MRGSAGVFYDRVPLRALANALLSAGNTTDLNNLRQISISLSPTQAGAPAFPGILGAPIPSVTLVNFTTMDANMKNAFSRQGSVEIEQQLTAHSTIGVAYQYLDGENLIVSVNQNVPSCVAVGTNNGCRPNPTYANNSQYSPLARSTYHGLHVSFVQRPTVWGSYRVSYSLSKSMNNVGENFFSSPIDPFDIDKDWGRSDDDQRHRLVLNGSINSPMTPARTALELLTNGFQVSSMLQAYSALPFNITSGRDDRPGHGRPADRRWRVHRTECRHGKRLLHAEPAGEPRVQDRREPSRRRDDRGVQPDEPAQRSDANHELRRGRLSGQSGDDLQSNHRGGRSADAAVRGAGPVLGLVGHTSDLTCGS